MALRAASRTTPVEIHIGDEGLEHAAWSQGGGIEADHIALFVLCLASAWEL
jgi:hypothetical protein